MLLAWSIASSYSTSCLQSQPSEEQKGNSEHCQGSVLALSTKGSAWLLLHERKEVLALQAEDAAGWDTLLS